MTARTDSTRIIANPGEPFLTIEREFDALPDLVFDVFTRAEHIVRWWGPRSLTTTVDRLDVRPGGEWRYVSRGPDGAEHAFRGVFQEVVRPSRIVWTFEYEGAPGHVSVEEVRFERRDDRTLVTSVVRHASVEARDAMIATGMEHGLRESYQRIDELVADAAARAVVQRRVFDAPRERVWEMWTERQYIDQWWGPRAFTNRTYEMDVRPGGAWRFDMVMTDGPTFPNRVTYLEVVRPERLVFWHGDDTNERLFHVTISFVDNGNGTTELTQRSLFPSAAERDYVVREYNAVELGRETLDKLAERLELA